MKCKRGSGGRVGRRIIRSLLPLSIGIAIGYAATTIATARRSK